MKDVSHKARNAYFIYLGILGVLLLFFLMYCRKSLELYEDAQPSHIMEQLLETLAANGVSENALAGMEFNEKNPMPLYQEEISSLLTSTDLTYYKLKENYSDGSCIYGIFAEDTKIAQATLLPGKSYNRMYLLTITEWSLGKVDFVPYRCEYQADITVPSDYTITINGSAPDDKMLTDRVEDSSLAYCQEYVTIPPLESYHAEGYSHPLDIRITDADGKIVYSTPADALAFSPLHQLSSASPLQENTQTVLSYGYAQPQMPEELSAMVLENVERYSNFFSRDLPGGLESIDPIRDLFPEDSIYLTLADQYRREDIRVFSSHTNTHFENEKITDYTVYSKDCFSCRVYFDKSMSLGGREMIDTTDNVYYYVCINGSWVIADIQ